MARVLRKFRFNSVAISLKLVFEKCMGETAV